LSKAQILTLLAIAVLCAALAYIWRLPMDHALLGKDADCSHSTTCCRLSKWKIACQEGGDGSCVIIESTKTEGEDLPYCVPMEQ